MTNEINCAWADFMKALSTKDSEGVLTQIKCPLLELLDKQVNIDKARKALFKPEMGQLLKLYLKGLEFDELVDKLEKHEKNFIRAFGPDKFNHLRLLVKLKTIINQSKPKKGLLSQGEEWHQLKNH